MKLWHVAQWGNPLEGPDGYDTQCIIAAPDLETAIKFGSECIERRNYKYRDGLADVIYLLGEDGVADSEPPQMIVTPWLNPAYNMRHNPAWHRKYWDGNGTEWGTEKEIYLGPDTKSLTARTRPPKTGNKRIYTIRQSIRE